MPACHCGAPVHYVRDTEDRGVCADCYKALPHAERARYVARRVELFGHKVGRLR